MINTNRNFVNNNGLNEENSLPHLIEQMDPNCEGELNPFEHSSYFSNEEFIKTHLQTNGKLSILNLIVNEITPNLIKLNYF